MIDINGWQEIKLGQMGKFSTSSVDKKSIEGQKQVSLVNYMDVYSGNTIDSNIKLMKVSASVVERARSQVFRGDILFTPSSETPEDIGYSSVVGEELTDTLHSYHTVRFRPNSNMLDIQFSAWFANAEGVRKQFSQKCAGSTRYILSIPSFQSVKCKIPISLTVQRKIANCLDTVQTTIEKTEALIHKYQQIKAGLMHDLFTRGVTADGNLRPSRGQAPELYKETPIGWIPKEWEVILLNELATYQHGRPFPSTDYSDEGVLLLRPGNLHISGIVRFDEAHTTRIPNRWLFDCPSFVLKPNDIVMNLTAQSLEDQFLGRVCLNVGEEPALLNQRIARFKAHAVEHGFLYWILRSHQFRKQIEHTTQGTKVQHLYNSDLNRVLLGVQREIEEQNNISNLLKISTNKVQTNIVHLGKLIQLKQGLMHDLLTGKVQVKVDKEETAHV